MQELLDEVNSPVMPYGGKNKVRDPTLPYLSDSDSDDDGEQKQDARASYSPSASPITPSVRSSSQQSFGFKTSDSVFSIFKTGSSEPTEPEPTKPTRSTSFSESKIPSLVIPESVTIPALFSSDAAQSVRIKFKIRRKSSLSPVPLRTILFTGKTIPLVVSEESLMSYKRFETADCENESPGSECKSPDSEYKSSVSEYESADEEVVENEHSERLRRENCMPQKQRREPLSRKKATLSNYSPAVQVMAIVFPTLKLKISHKAVRKCKLEVERCIPFDLLMKLITDKLSKADRRLVKDCVLYDMDDFSISTREEWNLLLADEKGLNSINLDLR